MDYTKLFETQFPGIFDTQTGGSIQFYPAPKPGHAPMMIVLPGGGYTMHGWTESEPMAEAWNKRGYAVLLLRYSLMPDKYPSQVRQSCGAVAFARLMSGEFGIDPKKVYVIGFSAGGHLSGCTETMWNRPEIYEFLGVDAKMCRPDAAILSYAVLDEYIVASDNTPGYTAPYKNVTPDTPPTFIWHTSDDTVVNINHALRMASALAENRLKFEMHTYYSGPHGLSLCIPETSWDGDMYVDERIAVWIDVCDGWLRQL